MAAFIHASASIVFVDCRNVDFCNSTLLDERNGGVPTIRWSLDRVRGQHVALRLRLGLNLLSCPRVDGSLFHDLKSLDR